MFPKPCHGLLVVRFTDDVDPSYYHNHRFLIGEWHYALPQVGKHKVFRRMHFILLSSYDRYSHNLKAPNFVPRPVLRDLRAVFDGNGCVGELCLSSCK